MTQEQTQNLLKELSRGSAALAIVAAIPYSMGDFANFLPPEAKKWIAIIASCAALAGTLAHSAIQLVTWYSSGAKLPPTGEIVATLKLDTQQFDSALAGAKTALDAIHDHPAFKVIASGSEPVPAYTPGGPPPPDLVNPPQSSGNTPTANPVIKAHLILLAGFCLALAGCRTGTTSPFASASPEARNASHSS